MKPGDSLVAIEGTPIRRWEDFQRKIEGSINIPVALTLIRNGSRMTVTVTPAAEATTDTLTGKPKTVGKIGLLAKSLRDPIPFGKRWAAVSE